MTQGKVALVSYKDYRRLSQWKWHAYQNHGNWYAKRGARPQVHMHTLVLGLESGAKVDHRNGNGLDNQRSNLRRASIGQNNRNTKLRRDSSSGFKGVSWVKTHQLWSAYIDVDDKRTFLGYFEDPEDAARAYDQAAIEYHGEFAHPNFRLRELGGREWQRQWDEEDEGS